MKSPIGSPKLFQSSSIFNPFPLQEGQNDSISAENEEDVPYKRRRVGIPRLSAAIFSDDAFWALFRSLRIYVDLVDPVKCAAIIVSSCLCKSASSYSFIEKSPLELSAKLLNVYGGEVSAAITKDVTHVLVDRSDLARLPAILSYVQRYKHVCTSI